MNIQSFIEALTLRLEQKKLTLAGSKSIAYGVQLQISDGLETVPLNVYAGKKGITTTVGGSAASALKGKLQLILAGADEPGQGKPPGFENMEDFDGAWIGTDESGKGDFFGPLVVAAVYCDEKIAQELVLAGVKDCKTLADAKVIALADIIKKVTDGKLVELEMKPARYNNLYNQLAAEGKNLNHLLAWAHARVLEDMLQAAPCKFAIADQFANERYINSRLMEKGRTLTLVQTHKAERNIAVAAASVLARARFLTSIAELGELYHIELIKGASAAVLEIARSVAARHGRQVLPNLCKMHFKTTEQI